jgi:hypothetical protein
MIYLGIKSGGYVTFDISRQKTGIQGFIHIFADSMGHSTDFLHAKEQEL